MSYDETPLKTPYKFASESSATPWSNDQVRALTTSQQVGVQKLVSAIQGDSVSSKVLQVRSQSAMVFMVNDAPVTIIYDMVCPLQLLSTGSYDVLLEALHGCCPTSTWAKNFSIKCRVVSVDRHPANLKCERLYLEDRETGWQSSVFPCESHICFGMVGATMQSLCPSAVTGIISTALSLRHGNALQLFRECLHVEVATTLVLKRGSPRPSDVSFKENMMALFMSGSSASLLDAVLLRKLPNGNWRNRTAVEYFIAAGEPEPSRDDVAAMLSTTLIYIFLRSKPSVFARHRWTGMDIAIDELGRLECCHGLLCRTYARFLKKLDTVKQCSNGSTLGVGVQDWDTALHPAALPANNTGQELVAGADTGNSDAIADVAGGGSLSHESVTEERMSAQHHAHDRQKAASWLSGTAMSDLVLCRSIVDPLLGLMSMTLHNSGEAWELQQRVQCLKHLQQPDLEVPR
eukprot:6490581-Amphidinium_carterae.2